MLKRHWLGRRLMLLQSATRVVVCCQTMPAFCRHCIDHCGGNPVYGRGLQLRKPLWICGRTIYESCWSSGVRLGYSIAMQAVERGELDVRQCLGRALGYLRDDWKHRYCYLRPDYCSYSNGQAVDVLVDASPAYDSICASHLGMIAHQSYSPIRMN